MKTAKELARINDAYDDWKSLKLWVLASKYEKVYHEWNNIFPPVTDDRRIFLNTYKQVYEAIDSLTDNPNSWVCVAVNRLFHEDDEMMGEILARYVE